MHTHPLVLLLVFGAVLTGSLVVCLGVFGGFVRQGYRRLTMACPFCSRRRLRRVSYLQEPEPGSLYLCAACARRWFLPERGRVFQEASSPAYDAYFLPPAPPQSNPRSGRH